MIRTAAVFSRPEMLETVCSMLERDGISVRCHCRTGAETIRAVKTMGGGVVVCGYKLPDMTADRLSLALRNEAALLVLAKPAQLELCEEENLFKLSLPARPGELAGSMRMLIQLDQQKARASVPQRSEEEKALIARAKYLLMRRNAMTEAQAHAFLQRASMESGCRMTDAARRILANC